MHWRSIIFILSLHTAISCQPTTKNAPRDPGTPDGSLPTAASPPPQTPSNSAKWQYRWFVEHVTDGDTLHVKQVFPSGYTRVDKIRLLNIDTPEHDEPLYAEATKALKRWVRGGDITLIFQKDKTEDRGKYNRLLAYVFVNNTNVNLDLVRQGYSTYVTKYGKSRFHNAFIAAQSEAKSARRGMWAHPR